MPCPVLSPGSTGSYRQTAVVMLHCCTPASRVEPIYALEPVTASRRSVDSWQHQPLHNVYSYLSCFCVYYKASDAVLARNYSTTRLQWIHSRESSLSICKRLSEHPSHLAVKLVARYRLVQQRLLSASPSTYTNYDSACTQLCTCIPN